MLWEVEIFTKGPDAERLRVAEEYDLLTHSTVGADAIQKTSRGFLLQGELGREHVERLANELLVDTVAETGQIHGTNANGEIEFGGSATVLLKPGVMDPVAMSVIQTARQLGIPVESAQTFRRYFWSGKPFDNEAMHRKVLCNEAIERVIEHHLSAASLGLGSAYAFQRIIVPILALDDAGLVKLSKEGQLSLSIDEMKTIQTHFLAQQRDPTDIELETIAQTWSEHCSHKTLKGIIEVSPPPPPPPTPNPSPARGEGRRGVMTTS